MVTRSALDLALHDLPRPHGRERRAAGDPAGPRRAALTARVDSQRVRARVRGAAPVGREARRFLWTEAHLPARPRRVHRELARLRARHERRNADRRPNRAGGRRRLHPAGDALDHLGDLPAPRARDGDRDLGRRRRRRPRARPACRRSTDRDRQLALDLLRQRPDRNRRARRRTRARARVARCLGGAKPRSPGARDFGGGALRAHVRTRRGKPLRLDVDADHRLLRRGRSRSRGLRRDRAALTTPHARSLALPGRHLLRRQHRQPAQLLRPLRRLLLHLDLPPDDPGLQRRSRGRDAASLHGRDDFERRRCRAGHRPDRCALADGGRDGAARTLAAAPLAAPRSTRRSPTCCPGSFSVVWESA